MLNLVEVIRLKNIEIGNYKIHLATGNNPTPLEAFLEGSFKYWQETQNGPNFNCENILALISLGRNKWLFAGVYKVLGVTKGTNPPYLYRTELLAGQDDLIGRVIVQYQRAGRASYVKGHKYGKDLVIVEIRPTAISIQEFPGYNDIIVTHRVLGIIVAQQELSWKSALSNVKGIYLITDTANGKLYVGKADGEGGIWQRWESYIKNGHGGNRELNNMIKENGVEYASNFQYSILEIADSHSKSGYLDGREKYWKDALLSRRFGYNEN